MEEQLLMRQFAHGIKVELSKSNNLFLVTSTYILEGTSYLDYINSEESDALLWYLKYHHALLCAFDNPELLMPYPWMYEEVKEGDEIVDEDDDTWLLNMLQQAGITCPHCKTLHTREFLYKMMKGFNIQKDKAWLLCPNCKREFVVSYGRYYSILLGDENNGTKENLTEP